MNNQPANIMKISLKCMILTAFFATLVLTSEIQEPCEDQAKHTPDGYIYKLDITGCTSREDCFINKGHNLNVGTIGFVSKSNSSQAEMHILVSSHDENDESIQIQIPGLKSDLCAVQKYRMILGGTENSTELTPQCNIKAHQKYILNNYQFFIPRLMPTGNVNLTFLITGHDDFLSCALTRVVFKD